jgi:hypothetical protein
MPLKEIATVPEGADVPQLKEIATVPEPGWGEVLSGVPERVGLSFIEAGGGALRGLGDLIGSETLADTGAEVARNARGAAQDSSPEGMSLPQQVVSSGLESAGQMLPALAVAPASIPAVGIALAAGQQGASRYSELRDAGFSGGRSGLHAAVDALAEGLGEAVSLPVLAHASRPFVGKLAHFLSRDLVGEEFTTAMEQANAMLSDKPDMSWGEFLDGLKMTALTTPVAAGAQVGAAHLVTRIRNGLAPSTDPINPPLDKQPTVAPVTQPVTKPPAPLPEDLPRPRPEETPEPTGVTPPAPQPEATLPKKHVDDGWTPVPDQPNTFTHPNGAQITYGTTDGGDQGWLIRAPDAFVDVQTAFKEQESAFATVKNRGWLETLPENWGWDAGAQRAQFDPSPVEPPRFEVGGYGNKWNLYDGGKNVRQVEGVSLPEAIKLFTPEISKRLVAPPVAPPQPAPPKPGGYASMFDTTPDQMFREKKFDPRLLSFVTSHVKITGDNKSGWDVSIIQDPKTGDISATEHFASATKVLDQIAKMYGIDPRTMSQEQLTILYNNAVQSAIIASPDHWLDVSAAVNDHFGGQLQNIAAAVAERNKLIGKTLGSTEGSSTAILHLQKRQLGDVIQSPETIAPDGSRVPNSAFPQAGPGTYIAASIAQAPHIKEVYGVVEKLRAKYVPDVKIVLSDRHVLSNVISNGATQPLATKTYVVSASDILQPRAHLLGYLMHVLVHEMGHVVIFERLARAPAHVQAEITSAWLKYTQLTSADQSLKTYLAEHNVRPRDVVGRRTVSETQYFNRYVMSLSEYLADQAANHFLYREEASGWTGLSNKVTHWLDQLVQHLRDLFDGLPPKFKSNKTFTDWLDALAKSNEKASPMRPIDQKKPPVDGPIRPKAKPTNIVSRDQAYTLIVRANKIFDALVAAGATRAEIESLNPSNNIANFNWEAAWDLLDRYGVKPYQYGGKFFSGSIDDTKLMREQVQEMNRKVGRIDPDLREAIGESVKGVKRFNWLLQKTMTAVQLRKRFGESVPGVKAFVDTLERMFSYRSSWKEKADTRVSEMKKTSHAERERVFNMLLDEDTTSTYASTITRDQTTGRRIFTPNEEMIRKYKLTQTGIDLYSKIRQDFDQSLEEMEQQARDELERLYSSGPGLTKALAELHDGFAQMKARPYVPHTRFGDHTITVREGGVLREFYQFETEHDAKKAEEALRAEYGNSAVVSRGKMNDVQKMMVGLPPQLIHSMKAQLGLSEQQIAQFEDILKEMSNGASFVRRFKRRKNIAGWADNTDNFPRAYADYMSRFANHISRLKYNHILTAATTAVRGQAVDASREGTNTVELNDLGNWLTRLHDYINNPGTEFANIRAAATLWYLGLNVKSALVNSTSVPMVTLPYLSKRFGNVRSFAVLTQAYKDLAKNYTRQKALTQDERLMLEQLRHDGKIDASFASELAGLREGGRLSDQMSLTKLASVGFGMKYYGMWLFQRMEVINRQVTALAAYRLARTEKNFDPNAIDAYDKRAMQFAGSAIQDTQNENAQWNRAEFMRGRKSMLTMFMSYQQNMIYQMLGGDQSWARLLAAQLLMAGMMGLPFAQDIDELIKAFSRKVFGSDMNAEKAVRALLKDSGVSADWLIKGASHNVFGTDLSGSLSMGRVIPGIDALAMEGKFPDRIANAAGDVGGAGFSILMNFLKALSSNDPDKWRVASSLPPEFAKAMIQGGEMLTSGKALDSQGRLIQNVTTGDGLLRSLGFQISDVSQEKAKRFAQRDVATYWLTRREYVLAEWELAIKSRDPSWREKANAALKEFNSETPDRSLKITADQLRNSIKARAVADNKVEHGLPAQKSLTETYRRVGELYQ